MQVDEATLHKALKKVLLCPEAEQPKRAGQAIRDSKHYVFQGLLYRQVWDACDNAMAKRVVIPSGSIRSFHYNGWRYRLPLRKAILLMYHDSETIGGHPGFHDTKMSVSSQFWWPGLERDVRRWRANCPTCRMVKPAPALTAPQRMELHNRQVMGSRLSTPLVQ